ncbi:unnamed protein product [Phyllotreta striolata]|uniref:Uncharacterized protein n=1 Tax=Phyllotreta striolata TaxID=444603 RepID=A0A9N9TXS8_PHYSR|nr:unnamed protein product [Phyllotreta striolata]
MILIYVIFSLDIINGYCFNAAFIRKTLELGGSFTFLGVAGFFASTLSFFWKPTAGSLGDRNGPSKLLTPCILANLLAFTCTYFSNSLTHLLLCRLILAFSSPTQSLLRTIVTNTSKTQQSENLAKLGIAMPISVIIASLAYGQLSELPNGVHYIFAIITANASISLTISKLLPKETPRVLQTRSTLSEIQSSLRKLRSLSTSGAYWDVFLIKALAALSFGAIESNGVLIFEAKGFTGKNAGYLMTVMFVTVFLTNVSQVKINRRFYSDDTGYLRLSHASAFIIICMLVQGFNESAWVFGLFVVISGIGRCVLEQSMMELLLSKVEGDEKGMLLGSFDSIQSVTELFVPLLSGVTLEFLGLPALFAVSSILLSLECALAYSRRNVGNLKKVN